MDSNIMYGRKIVQLIVIAGRLVRVCHDDLFKHCPSRTGGPRCLVTRVCRNRRDGLFYLLID